MLQNFRYVVRYPGLWQGSGKDCTNILPESRGWTLLDLWGPLSITIWPKKVVRRVLEHDSLTGLAMPSLVTTLLITRSK